MKGRGKHEHDRHPLLVSFLCVVLPSYTYFRPSLSLLVHHITSSIFHVLFPSRGRHAPSYLSLCFASFALSLFLGGVVALRSQNFLLNLCIVGSNTHPTTASIPRTHLNPPAREAGGITTSTSLSPITQPQPHPTASSSSSSTPLIKPSPRPRRRQFPRSTQPARSLANTAAPAGSTKYPHIPPHTQSTPRPHPPTPIPPLTHARLDQPNTPAARADGPSFPYGRAFGRYRDAFVFFFGSCSLFWDALGV